MKVFNALKHVLEEIAAIENTEEETLFGMYSNYIFCS